MVTAEIPLPIPAGLCVWMGLISQVGNGRVCLGLELYFLESSLLDPSRSHLMWRFCYLSKYIVPQYL
jgi:hypothetical protein